MWEKVKLGDVCDLQNGFAFKSNLFKEDGLPILRISNIQEDIISLEKLVYFSENDYSIDFERYKVHQNDLLIAMSGATTGKLGFNQSRKTFFLNQRVGKFLPHKTLNKKYLYYILSTKVEENLNISRGAAQPNLSTKQIKDIEFFLPPLAEQERIVAKLDAAFAEIDEAIELTALKKEEINHFKCSILDINNKNNNFFTCALHDFEKLKIGEICNLMTGGTPSRKVPEYFENGEIKWLVSGDINQKEIFDCDGRITEEGLNNSNAKFLPENSVLMALNGQGKTRGTVAMLKTKATCNQSLVSIFPKPGVNLNTKYLYYFLEGMYDKIRRITGDSGNDRRGLNMPLIRNIEILLPPITEQENIILKLETAINKLDIANKAVNEAINNYKALKSAILSKELQPSEAA